MANRPEGNPSPEEQTFSRAKIFRNKENILEVEGGIMTPLPESKTPTQNNPEISPVQIRQENEAQPTQLNPEETQQLETAIRNIFPQFEADIKNALERVKDNAITEDAIAAIKDIINSDFFNRIKTEIPEFYKKTGENLKEIASDSYDMVNNITGGKLDEGVDYVKDQYENFSEVISSDMPVEEKAKAIGELYLQQFRNLFS
jgi:hypothetical protein